MLDVGNNEFDEYSSRDFHSTGSFKFKPHSFRELHSLMPHQLMVRSSSCEIRGYDKPRLFMEGDKFYTAIYDATNALNSVGDHFLECFFITDAMPKLHIKQSHLYKNHLKTHYDVKNGDDLQRVERENYSFKEHVNASCRYPLWRQITVGKGNSFGLPYKEVLLCADAKVNNPLIADRYMGKMKNQEKSLLRDRCNDSDIFNGFAGILSKKYCLGV